MIIQTGSVCQSLNYQKKIIVINMGCKGHICGLLFIT